MSHDNLRRHEYSVVVQYEDCDIGGYLFHPNYLLYCERARSAAIAKRGLPFKAWLKKGVSLAIPKIECNFFASAALYDEVFIYSSWLPPREGGKSLKITQTFFNAPVTDFAEKDLSSQPGRLAEINFVLVCMQGADGDSVPIPDEISKFL